MIGATSACGSALRNDREREQWSDFEKRVVRFRPPAARSRALRAHQTSGALGQVGLQRTTRFSKPP